MNRNGSAAVPNFGRGFTTDTAVGGWLYERAQTMRFAVQPACATVSVFGDFCPKIIFHSKGRQLIYHQNHY